MERGIDNSNIVKNDTHSINSKDTNDTNKTQDTQGKSKLKGLFEQIELKKPKKKNPISDKNSKNKKERINWDIEYKTKPTKPDFTAQFIESGMIGLNLSSNSTSNSNNQYKGLTNFGNICYSNVVMQCVISLKEFVNMLNIIFKKMEELDNIQNDYPVLYNLVKIMLYYQIKNTALASSHIKLIVNMFDYSGEQNDAHEFLVFIFDKLNDEILKLSKIIVIEENKELCKEDETEWEEVKKGGKRMKQVNTVDSFQTSIIGKIFQGILKHEIESKGNSLSKCNIEPFFVLSLEFGENSINSCFTKFFSKRKIETSTTPIYQKTYMEKLPAILIIHLKAFYYDKNTKQIVKINKEIEYGENLKITDQCISPSMLSCYKKVEYELISVIIHRGTKASEGHYTCFCKDDKNVWWNIDDKKVNKVDESLFSRFRPYILFYRKLK